MCIRDRVGGDLADAAFGDGKQWKPAWFWAMEDTWVDDTGEIPVSYTHLRAHETVLDLVCRLLLEKKKAHETVLDLSCLLLLEKKNI